MRDTEEFKSHLISSGSWSVATVLRFCGPELQVFITELKTDAEPPGEAEGCRLR